MEVVPLLSSPGARAPGTAQSRATRDRRGREVAADSSRSTEILLASDYQQLAAGGSLNSDARAARGGITARGAACTRSAALAPNRAPCESSLPSPRNPREKKIAFRKNES